MRFPLALTGLSRYIGEVGSLGRRVTLILPAALIVWTARVPRPVGYLLGLGGVAYLVTGWIFGAADFAPEGALPNFIRQDLPVVAVVYMLIIAWRMPTSEAKRVGEVTNRREEHT